MENGTYTFIDKAMLSKAIERTHVQKQFIFDQLDPISSSVVEPNVICDLLIEAPVGSALYDICHTCVLTDAERVHMLIINLLDAIPYQRLHGVYIEQNRRTVDIRLTYSL